MAVETTAPTEVMRKVNAYEMFQHQEGIPILRGFAVDDLRTIEVKPWARRGVLGTYVNLDGTGGTNDAYVLEMPPGKATERPAAPGAKSAITATTVPSSPSATLTAAPAATAKYSRSAYGSRRPSGPASAYASVQSAVTTSASPSRPSRICIGPT